MNKKLFPAGLIVCLLLLLPLSALAATTLTFSLTCPSDPTGATVNSRYQKKNYTLAIPGHWDPSSLIITFGDDKPVFIGEQEVSSGDTLDVTPWLGSEQTLKNAGGKNQGTILFQQGSRVVSVFIEADAEELTKVMKDKHRIISQGSIRISEPDGTVVWDGPFSQFKGRGNNTYSSGYKKKPFQVKLPGKVNISGMGKSKTWLLIANYVDLSLLRNQIALNLALESGMRFGVESVQADLWLNGVYNGLYLLTEKIQINSSRVDITNLEDETEELNDEPVSSYPTFRQREDVRELRGYEIPNDPEDITGGYIVELDKPYRFRKLSDNGFRTPVHLYFVIKEPTCASRAQVNYISSRFEQLLRALNADDGIDPETGVHYATLMDMNSFAIKFLVEELTKNYDAMAGSQFFYKDRDSVDPKIYAGPCWDYDLSMGDLTIAGSKPEGHFIQTVTFGKTSWYKMLWKHEDFQAEVRRVYKEHFRPAMDILLGETDTPGQYVRSIEEYRAAIADSAVMNFTLWSSHPVSGYNTKSGKNFDDSVTWLIKWLQKRVAFMDTVYGE